MHPRLQVHAVVRERELRFPRRRQHAGALLVEANRLRLRLAQLIAMALGPRSDDLPGIPRDGERHRGAALRIDDEGPDSRPQDTAHTATAMTHRGRDDTPGLPGHSPRPCPASSAFDKQYVAWLARRSIAIIVGHLVLAVGADLPDRCFTCRCSRTSRTCCRRTRPPCATSAGSKRASRRPTPCSSSSRRRARARAPRRASMVAGLRAIPNDLVEARRGRRRRDTRVPQGAPPSVRAARRSRAGARRARQADRAGEARRQPALRRSRPPDHEVAQASAELEDLRAKRRDAEARLDRLE